MDEHPKLWQYVNRVAFFSTLILIILAFGVALPLGRHFGSGGIAQSEIWLRILATVALISTAVWYAIGFLSLYIGPHEFWDKRFIIGGLAFLGATACCFVAILSCLTGVVCVWVHLTHGHLWAASIAESLFWSSDYILLGSLIKRGQGPRKLSVDERAWILLVSGTLKGWIDFVARPATISLASLSLGVYLLETTGVLVTHLEVEIFATGALFLALMTTNLAFYAVNKGVFPAGLFPPFLPESLRKNSEEGVPVDVLREASSPTRKRRRRRRKR